MNLVHVLEGLDGVITFGHGVFGIVEPFGHASHELIHRDLLVVIPVEILHHLRRRRFIVRVQFPELDFLQELLQLMERDRLVSVLILLLKQTAQIN